MWHEAINIKKLCVVGVLVVYQTLMQELVFVGLKPFGPFEPLQVYGREGVASDPGRNGRHRPGKAALAVLGIPQCAKQLGRIPPASDGH